SCIIKRKNEVFTLEVFENLRSENEQLEKEINAVKSIIDFAKIELEKVKVPFGGFRTEAVIRDAQSLLRYMVERKEENDKKLKTYQKINRNEPIKFVHFKAGHRNFDHEELQEILECLHTHFTKPPFLCRN